MRHQSHRPSHRAFNVQPDSVRAPPLLTMPEMKEADKVPFLDAPVSSGSLFGPAVEGFAERFTETQKSSQAMRYFLPKRTSSSSASSCPRLAPTQQTAKPKPTASEPRPPEGRRDRGRSRSARCYPFQFLRSPWIRRLRNPPEQPGRKRRGPSLATAGAPRKPWEQRKVCSWILTGPL